VVGGVHAGWTAARSLLLLMGGFCLIFAAILLLKGGNLPADAFQLRPWRHRGEDREPLPQLFPTVSRRFTAIFTAAGILLAAAIPDYILWTGIF
jgi:hypothetical protein